MVLANTSPNSLNADIHSVPTVHVNDIAGAAIKAYVSGTASPTAALSAGVQEPGVEGAAGGAFSSRGPALAGGGDLLKPDIMAPGVDVIAGFSPANNGRNYDFVSGTSMSSPHIAGLGALLIQKHPQLVADDGQVGAADHRVGDRQQGRRRSAPTPATSRTRSTTAPARSTSTAPPTRAWSTTATRPTGCAGCAAPASWPRPAPNCSAVGSIDPSDLNQPNIAIGALAGRQTVTRTVTNVSSKARRTTRRRSSRRPASRSPSRRRLLKVKPNGDGDLPGHLHPHQRGLRPVRLRLADLDQRASSRSAASWPSSRSRRPRRRRSPAPAPAARRRSA